jgi:hypothetical protein
MRLGPFTVSFTDLIEPDYNTIMNIARTEAGTEVAATSAGAPPNNYIVGQYDMHGHKLRNGMTAGGSATEARIQSKLMEFMERKGDRVEPTVIPQVKTAKAKKGAAKPQAAATKLEGHGGRPYTAPSAILAPEPIAVAFSVKIGKIKAVVDAVLEHENGLALVFNHEDQMHYIPEQGNELDLLIGSRKIPVMYLGHVFSWHHGTQRIMTFIKLNEE